MIMLNLRFVTSKELTRERFFELLCDWVDSSHFSDDKLREEIKKFGWPDEPFTAQKADGTIQVSIDNCEEAFAVQVTNDEDGEIYRTNYVLRDRDEVPAFQCVQEKVFDSLRVQDDRRVKMPYLLRKMFWAEYGGDDHGLPVDDKAYVVRKTDLDLALNITGQFVFFDLPVVYVSPDSAGRYMVNYEILASELIGQAHVVVEGSPVVSESVGEAVGEGKPYGGAVKVYFSNKQSRLYRTAPMDYRIINDIREMQSSLNVPDEFCFDKIRQRSLFAKLSKSGDSELAWICEALINDKDAEIKSLSNKLKDVKQKLAVSASKAQMRNYEPGKALEQEPVLDKIRSTILQEKGYIITDFERYKAEYLVRQEWDDVLDSLTKDDFLCGMERCVEIIEKYRTESEFLCERGH